MEPVAAPPAEEKDTPAPNPVMDIRPPKSGEAPEPPRELTEQKPAPAEPAEKSHTDKAPAEPAKKPAPAAPNEPHSGVGLAITATVIIVLGLGAMMVYAYLRSNNL